jgi:hypothetical protein
MRRMATSGRAHDWPAVTVVPQCSKLDNDAARSSAERAGAAPDAKHAWVWQTCNADLKQRG